MTDIRLLKIRQEAKRTKENLDRKLALLESTSKELAELKGYREILETGKRFPPGMVSLLGDDRQSARFKVQGLIAERESAESRIASEIKDLKTSLLKIEECPRCKGTGRVTTETLYERTEEGRILEAFQSEICDQCLGSGKLNLGFNL